MGRRVTNGLTGNVGSSISSLSVVDNSLITVTTNQNVVIDPNGSGHVFTDAPFESTNATGSTTKATGAITTSGGVGVAGQIHAAGLNETPTSTLKFSAQDQYILVPNGTTAQRPSGVEGYTRYNTDLNVLEFYNGTTWIACGFRDVDVTGSRNLKSVGFMIDLDSSSGITLYPMVSFFLLN